MKRRIMTVSAVFIGLLIILAIALTLAIDQIVKSGIENIGSSMFRTQLSIDTVNISLFSGQGSIEGLVIYNPEGFDEGEALAIQSVRISMKPLTLLSDTVLINEVDVQMLDVTYDFIPSGSNLGQLQRNLDDYSETREPIDVVMVIDHFLMENASLTLQTNVEGVEPVTVTLPRVEHTGIGRNEDADITAVMIAVLDIILEQVTGAGVDQLREEGERRLREEADDALRNLLNSPDSLNTSETEPDLCIQTAGLLASG